MNSAVNISTGKVLYLDLPHFWLGGELRSGGLSYAHTRRSLRFLGQWKAMMEDGIACFSHSEMWMMLWCFLVMCPTGGNAGLYTITRGVLCILPAAL